MRFAPFTLLFAAGCLGGMPSTDPPGGRAGHLPSQITTMAAPATDSGPGTTTDGGTVTPPGSGTPDLGGLVDCYGVAACDPTMMFCIKFYPGSQSSPGTPTVAPSCFQPDGDCADQGQNMDCGCIQNDDILGPACQGACVDNGDGTYSCFAQS